MAIHKLFSKILLIQAYHTTCVSFSCRFTNKENHRQMQWIRYLHDCLVIVGLFRTKYCRCLLTVNINSAYDLRLYLYLVREIKNV